MSREAAGWLDALGPGDPVVRDRMSAFAGQAGAEGIALATSWLEEPERRTCVVDVFSTCEESGRCTPAALRLLLVAARQAGRGGPRSLLARLAAGPASGGDPFDLEALAAEITPVALEAAEPEGILAATIRWILDPRVPLFSLTALGGTARLASAGSRIEYERREFAEQALLELRAGPLLGSRVWKEAAALQGGSRADAFERIVAALGAPHIEELVASCSGDLPREEHELALGLLVRLARDRDPRLAAHRAALAATLRGRLDRGPTRDWSALTLWVLLDRRAAQEELQRGLERPGALDRSLMSTLLREPPAADERDAWVAALAWLNRAAFMQGSVIPEALVAWHGLDADAVSHYLTEELDLDTMAQGPLAVVVGTLVRIGGPGAAPTLRRLVERPDRIGRSATIGLEIIGASPPREIERLCAEWRAIRSSQALAALYNEVIDALPAGMPFGPWRARLGPPTSEVDGSLWYHSGDGGYRLYLDVGRDERLTAWSLR
jgi:hypothetical protein